MITNPYPNTDANYVEKITNEQTIQTFQDLSIPINNLDVVDDGCQTESNTADTGSSFSIEINQNKEMEKLSVISAALSIFNGTLGAGLLNYPYVYKEFGSWISAVLIQILIIPFVAGTYLTLAYLTYKSKKNNYFDIVELYAGKVMKAIVQTLVGIILGGSCIAYCIFVGDQLEHIIILIFGENCAANNWYCDRRLATAIGTSVLFLPLMFFKKLTFLSYTSFLGTLSAFYIVFSIVYEYFAIYLPNHTDAERARITEINFNPSGIVGKIGVMIFAYQNQVPTVAIYGQMKNKTLPRFFYAVVLAMTMCAILYTTMGIFGYLCFGNDVNSDILFNFDSSDKVILAGRILLLLVLMTSYSLTAYGSRTAIHQLATRIKNGCCKLYKKIVLKRNKSIDASLMNAINSYDNSPIVSPVSNNDNSSQLIVDTTNKNNRSNGDVDNSGTNVEINDYKFPSTKSWAISGSLFFHYYYSFCHCTS